MPQKYTKNQLPFRNQILLSEIFPLVEIEGFSSIRIGVRTLQYSNNLPLISAANIHLLGWAWNCTTGSRITQEFVNSLNPDNIVDRCTAVSGRYIIIFEDGYLYTDSTSSLGIYFDRNTISTSLTLLCKVTNRPLPNIEKYSGKQFIPPLTAVEGVRKLMAGQYLNFTTSFEAVSISNFLKTSEQFQSVDDQIGKLSSHLINCARGLVDAVDNDYQLTFTSGKDSRLSFLSLYKLQGKNVKTLTNKKRFFLDNPNDILIPELIASRLGTNHSLICPKPEGSDNSSLEYEQHCHFQSTIRCEGSPYSYYHNGNLMQIESEFLVYNYYETGRMHLVGKRWIDFENGVSFDNLSKYFMFSEESFNDLLNHMKIISPDGDLKDTFYFLRHYSNVAEIFEQMDFTHTPLSFCNSRYLFANLLNVPVEFRSKSIFHKRLLAHLTPSEIADVDCNPNEDHILFKIRRRLVDRIGNTLRRIVLSN